MRLKLDVPKLIFLIFTSIYFVECKKFQIVGGHAASILQFPFQVVYYNKNDFVCSGSLIARSYILTAAHCTHFYSGQITVRLGSSNREDGGILLNVTKHYVHPAYNYKTYDYDFAILKLSSPVNYSSTIQPALLPKGNQNISVGTECTVSGWGYERFDELSYPPTHLLMADIEISNFTNCMLQYKDVSSLTDRMLCASVPDGSRDACLGDSGGPLVCNGILTGVVSFGIGCAMKEYPGIYSKISYVLPWIRNRIKYE